MLFSPVETTSNKDNAVKNSATSPLFKPNHYLNPTSTALPLPGPGDPKLRRSTPMGAVGPPRTKSNNLANVDLQPTPNTQEAPSNTVQNLTSGICKLGKLFADEKSTYTSITAGIPSQYFFYVLKIASLNLAIQMLSFENFPQRSLYSTLQKWPVHHLTHLLNRPQVLVVLSSGLTPRDTTSSSNSTLMLLDPLLPSVLQFYSPSSLETTTIFSNGPSQSSSTLVFEIKWTH